MDTAKSITSLALILFLTLITAPLRAQQNNKSVPLKKVRQNEQIQIDQVEKTASLIGVGALSWNENTDLVRGDGKRYKLKTQLNSNYFYYRKIIKTHGSNYFFDIGLLSGHSVTSNKNGDINYLSTDKSLTGVIVTAGLSYYPVSERVAISVLLNSTLRKNNYDEPDSYHSVDNVNQVNQYLGMEMSWLISQKWRLNQQLLSCIRDSNTMWGLLASRYF